MPIAKYNPLFGGERGSAAKAKRSMKKQYGAKKGEQRFYATANKRKKQSHRKMSIMDYQR